MSRLFILDFGPLDCLCSASRYAKSWRIDAPYCGQKGGKRYLRRSVAWRAWLRNGACSKKRTDRGPWDILVLATTVGGLNASKCLTTVIPSYPASSPSFTPSLTSTRDQRSSTRFPKVLLLSQILDLPTRTETPPCPQHPPRTHHLLCPIHRRMAFLHATQVHLLLRRQTSIRRAVGGFLHHINDLIRPNALSSNSSTFRCL